MPWAWFVLHVCLPLAVCRLCRWPVLFCSSAVIFLWCRFLFSSFFLMESLREQRAAVKFCFLVSKSAAKTVLTLNVAYINDRKRKTQVHEWFSRLKNDMSTDDKSRSERPSIARTDWNVGKSRELVFTDGRQTSEQFSEICEITRSSVQWIWIKDLGMEKLAATFVLWVLTENPKNVTFGEKLHNSVAPGTLFLVFFSYFHAWRSVWKEADLTTLLT